MYVHLIKLMFQTFHSCRHSQPYSGTCLQALVQALAAFSHQNTIIVLLPLATFQQLPPRIQEKIRLPEDHLHLASSSHITIPQSAQSLLALVLLATSELQQLWQHQQFDIVRALGYTLHIIPHCLQEPSRFRPPDYMFAIFFLIDYWNQLSPDLRNQFAALIGLEIEELYVRLEAMRHS